MKKAIKITARILMWFLIGVIALLAIVLIAIQTAPVKKQIVRIAETQVNNMLDAELSVGALTGNFFTHLGLENVILRSTDNDTIAVIQAVQLRYKLLPLLSGRIVVDEVVIESPFIQLEQMPDSTWNVMHIMKPSDEEPDTTSSSFNMSIEVERLALNNGRVNIHSFNPQIPRTVDSLFIDIKGHYASNYQEVDIRDFRLLTYEPYLAIRELAIQATADTEVVNLANLALRTNDNSLSGKGTYYFDKNQQSKVTLHVAPVVLSEFEYYLPDSFQLGVNPELNLDATLKDTELALQLLVKEQAQEVVDLNLSSYYLIEYLSDTTGTPVSYDLALNMKQIDVKHWLNDPALNYVINGHLTAKGEGLQPETMQANVKGNFGDIILYGNPVRNLDIVLDYDRGNADGTIQGSGSFGALYVKPSAQRILSDYPSYSAYVDAKQINLAALLGEEYKSNINLNASVKGAGTSLDRLNAAGKIIMKPSDVMGIKLDTLNADVNFARQNLVINSFLLESLSAHVNAEGNYNMKGNSDLNLTATLKNAREIAQFAGIDSLETSLDLTAHVMGQPDDLAANLNLGVGRTRFQDIRMDTLFAQVDGTVRNMKDIDADADIRINRLLAAGNNFDDIHLTVQTDTRNYTLGLDANGQDIQTRMSSLIKLGDNIEIILSDLWLNYKNYALRQASDTAYISIGDNEYIVNDFHLVHDSIGTNQSIYLDGKIDRAGEQDLQLNISDINVAELVKVFAPDMKLQGILNLDMKLEGAADSPQLTAKLNVDSTALDQYRFDSISSNISLLNKELNLDLNVIPVDTGRIIATGKLPMEVRLDSMLFNVVPKDTDPIALRLLIDRLPLNILNIFLPTDETNGSIESDINVAGTMGSPEIDGKLNIRDGLVKMNLYGINYRDIQTNINVRNDQVSIDTFQIRSHDGTMNAQGNVQFSSEIYKGDLNTSDLKIRFNRFNPVDHKSYNMELSGNVDLEGRRDSVYFSGNLEIPEAQVYLPALMALFGRRSVPDIPKPLLVAEMEKAQNEPDSIVYTFHPDSLETESPSLDFLNNLQGSLRVVIPRNTWIRNDDMRFELSGDVEIRKHREFFELFGTVDVVRGQYNLLGKVFVIQTGTITFQGGEKLNPMLNVEALYSFRQREGDRKELTVYVTGEMLSPEIRFTMDGDEVSEGDAISYILFGTRMDDITSTLGQGDGASASDLAGTVASSLISSQLTRLLGNTLNVDYIELNTTSDFQNASIVVGKYITNKLFVSYEQNIGNLDNLNDKTVARYEMKMEYELFKFLFLQLTSSPITNGFDVIFKFNSKVKPTPVAGSEELK